MRLHVCWVSRLLLCPIPPLLSFWWCFMNIPCHSAAARDGWLWDQKITGRGNEELLLPAAGSWIHFSSLKHCRNNDFFLMPFLLFSFICFSCLLPLLFFNCSFCLRSLEAQAQQISLIKIFKITAVVTKLPNKPRQHRQQTQLLSTITAKSSHCFLPRDNTSFPKC